MTPKPGEQGVVIALGDGTVALEGIYLAGDGPDAGGAVIAAPHPLYGGSMESPVVNEIAYACGRAGLASLCFNWRGVGASAGEPSGEAADADADYAAAALHLARTVCRRAERACVGLAEVETVRPEALRYLNRLSDLLFVMARAANIAAHTAEVPWAGRRGGADRSPPGSEG